MTSTKEKRIILYFLAIISIPLIWVIWGSAGKLLDVIFLHPADYVITHVSLTENSCKKYRNLATFDINYDGTTAVGYDGCVLWADKGDLVKVYFKKNNLYDNGVYSKLIILFIRQLVLLLSLVFLFVKQLKSFKKIINMFKIRIGTCL